MARKWTREEHELAVQLIRDGASLPELAEPLNRTVFGVEAHFKNLGITVASLRDRRVDFKEWRNDEVEIAMEMLKNGCSTRRVSERLGRTRDSIIGKFNRMHMPVGSLNGLSFKPGNSPRVERIVGERPMLKRKDPKRPGRTPLPPQTGNHKPNIIGRYACEIWDLNHRTCHWPLWDKRADKRLYCGAPVTGKTYCIDHWGVATTNYKYSAKYTPRRPR